MNKISFWHHHIGLSVPDLDASIAWYENMLDFEVIRRSHIADIPADIAIMRNGSMHIELLCAHGAKLMSPERSVPEDDIQTHGNKHGCFATNDVRAIADTLKKRGADVLWVREYGGGRMNCFVRDNAGNLIEFLKEEPYQLNAGSLKKATDI